MAFGVTVDFNANLARFTSAIDKATHDLNKFQSNASRVGGNVGKILSGLGVGISVAGVLAYAKSVLESVDALNDLKDATGSSIENLSALEDLAARTGTKFDSMSSTLVKFNKVLSDSKDGSDAAKILEAIGLSAEKLKQLDPAEALRQTAVALSRFADDGDKARIVQELFGKGIREAAPFLAELAKKSELVGTVSTATADQAEKLNQELAKLKKNSTDAGREILAVLVPTLNSLIDRFKKLHEQRSIGEVVGKLATGGVLRIPDLLKTDEDNGRASGGKISFPKVDGAEGAKPKLKVDGLGAGAGGKDDPAKKQLDNSLADFKLGLDQEKDLLDARNKMLELYNGENLISLKDYYAGRKAAADEALANSLAQLDKEIAALESYRSKVKTKTEKEDITGKINEALEKKSKLQRDAGEQALEMAIREKAAYRSLGDEVQAVNIKLLEMQGRTGDAARMNAESQFAPLLKKLELEGRTGDTVLVQQLKAAQVAQAEFNELLDKNRRIQDTLKNAEDRLAITRSTGAITELDYLQQVSEERRKASAQLEVTIEQLDRIAESSGLPNLKAQAEQSRVALEELQSQSDLLAEKFRKDFKESASDALADFISGAKSASDAFSAFADNVKRKIAQMAADNIIDAIFGASGTKSGTDGGSFSDRIGGFIGSILGGKKAEPNFAGFDIGSLAGGVGAADNPFEIFGFASGGNPPVGRPYLVGENGPELVVDRTPKTIIPNHMLGGMGGGVNLTYSPNIHIDSRQCSNG
jgi:hypothetical protein